MKPELNKSASATLDYTTKWTISNHLGWEYICVQTNCPLLAYSLSVLQIPIKMFRIRTQTQHFATSDPDRTQTQKLTNNF